MLSKDERIELAKKVAHFYTNNKTSFPYPLKRTYQKEPEGTFNVLKYPLVFNDTLDEMIADFYAKTPIKKIRKRIPLKTKLQNG